LTESARRAIPNANARRYRELHPERVKESQQRYRAANRAAILVRRTGTRSLGRNRALAAAYRKKRALLAMAFIDAARAGGCVDCGIKNLSVLQSDHVRGVKAFEPSSRLQLPIQKILAELEKCETRCANCHQLASRARRRAA